MSEPAKSIAPPVPASQRRIIDLRCKESLHIGTDVGGHWTLGKSKSGTSAILGMEQTPAGVVMRVESRGGQRRSYLVPYSNISFAVLEE